MTVTRCAVLITALAFTKPAYAATKFMGSTDYSEQNPGRMIMSPGANASMPVVKIAASGQWDCCSKFSTAARSLLNAWELFVEYINGVRGGLMINGVPHAIEVTLVNDFSSSAKTTANLQMLMGEGYKLFLGPYGTGGSKAAAKAVHDNFPNAFLQAPVTSSAAVFQDRPHVWSALGNGADYFKTAAEMIFAKVNQAGLTPRAVILEEKHPVSSGWATGASALLKSMGFDVVSHIKVAKFAGKSSAGQLTLTSAALDWKKNISALDMSSPLLRPIVIGATYSPQTCTAFLKAAEKEGLRKYVGGFFFTLCVGTPGFFDTLGSAANYVSGVGFWSEQIVVQDYFANANAADFSTTYRSKFSGLEPVYQAAASWASIASLSWAIEQANSVEPQAVAQQFQRLQNGEKLPTIYGDMYYDFRGLNQAPSLVTQVIGNEKSQTLIKDQRPLVFPYPVCSDTEQVDFTSHTCVPVTCPLGEEWLVSQRLCVPCRKGLKRGSGDTACVQCPKGSYSSAEGAQQCSFCPSGEYASELGSEKCTPCGPGQFNADPGAAYCANCPKGSYSNSSASSQCIECGDLNSKLTTLNIGSDSFASCMCDDNHFLMQGQCVACYEDGMSCALSLGANRPRQQEGFWLEASGSGLDTSYSLFKCAPPDACPAGSAGACETHRVGFACSKCESGMYNDGFTCHSCDNGAGWPAFIIIFTALFGSPLMYFAANGKKASEVSAIASAGTSMAVMVNLIQTVAVISLCAVPTIPSVVLDVFGVARIFLFDVQKLGIDCLFGSGSGYFSKYALQVFTPGVVLILMYSAWLVSQASLPKFSPWQIHKVWNTIGVICNVAIVTITSISITPTLCYEHPQWHGGESSSMIQYPSVFCGSNEHTPLLVLGMAALLFYTAGFLAVSAFAVWRAPSAISKSREDFQRFHQTYKYLFGRFRPECFYSGLTLLMRNSIITFLPALAPKNGHLQLIIMQIVVMTYLAYTFRLQPWRVPMMNAMDGTTTAVLLLILNVVTCFSPVAFGDGFSVYTIALFMVGLIVPTTTIGYITYASLTGTPMTGAQQKDVVSSVQELWMESMAQMQDASAAKLTTDLKNMPPYNFFQLKAHLSYLVNHGLVTPKNTASRPHWLLTSVRSSLSFRKSFADKDATQAETKAATPIESKTCEPSSQEDVLAAA